MKKALIFIILFCAVNLSLVFALSGNETIAGYKEAKQCLDNSAQIMQEMQKDDFNVQRINDSIKTATQIFDAQRILDERKQKVDYSFVISSCTDIENIKAAAYEAKDLLFSLNQEYADFKSKVSKYNVNTSEVDSMVSGINQEMRDERYEKIKEEVPVAENKMAQVEAEATTMNLFYSTITGGLKEFFIKNYIMLLVILAVIVLFFVMYRLKIRKSLIMRKLRKLEVQRKVLKDMIKKTQQDYFEGGQISQGIYNIKTKKYAELIRDIDRQTPLLKEELERLKLRHREKF